MRKRLMTKQFQWGLVLILAFTLLLAGCSQASPADTETDGEAEETVQEDGASGAEEEADEQSGSEDVRAAFVYVGPTSDKGWTWAHDQGRLYLEEQLGVETAYVENVPESADAERVIRDFAEQGYDVIFTTSFGYMDYTLNVAEDYPETIFLHASGYKTAENMGTYFGRNYQASYLTGVAAGMLSENNQLGYVGAHPIPEVIYNINAFTLGAQSVNPEATTRVVWANTWFDPPTEREAANSLLDTGVDVLAAYLDSPASIQAAAERGVWGIANDTDMGEFAPETYVTNPVWNWGPYYVDAVQSIIDGTWESSQYWGGMDEEIVDLAPWGENVPDEVKREVEALKEQVIAGEKTIFTGPIYNQDGELVVEEGAAMTGEEILNTNWFVQGVEGTIPQ